jgi:DNA polymerase
MTKLYFDFETRSHLDLSDVGLDVYVRHQATEVLMMAYAVEDAPVTVWEPRLSPIPDALVTLLTDPAVTKVAWNVPFEFNILAHVLKVPVPLNQFHDPMAQARYLALPGSLKECGEVLGLTEDKAKDEDGKRLIKMFCAQSKALKKQLAAGSPPFYYRDWNSHPEEWVKFVNYCARDVEAMRALCRLLNDLGKMPPEEYRVWMLDQLINHRGMPVDMVYVDNASAIAQAEINGLQEQLKALTALENPNSPAQLKAWLADHEFVTGSTDKAHITEALTTKVITPEVRQVLEIKKRLGGTSYTKLEVIQQRTVEGRLRHQFTYCGAHTGRWSSHGVQLQNLARPSKAVKVRTEEIVEAIRLGGCPSDIPPMECVGGTLRASFRAPVGSRFCTCDLSSIEYRVLAWVTRCKRMQQVLTDGRDPYKAFAVTMFATDYDAVTGDQRQQSKPPVLGCGYGMQGLRLLEYAAGMGVEMSIDDCDLAVAAYRSAYPEIVWLWAALEAAVVNAIQLEDTRRVRGLIFDGTDRRMLKIILPSGRLLHYYNPQAEGGRVCYESQKMGRWMTVDTHGSKLVENIVQAIARDVLVHGMLAAHRAGFQLVGHVHDELIAEVPHESPLTLEQFRAAMIEVPSWAAGLSLDAAGFESEFYKKD